MPSSYIIDDGVLRIIYEGHYTTEDEFATLREAIEATGFAPGMPLLVDLSGSIQGDSQRESRSLALVLGGLRRRIGRRCAVVVSDQLQYRLARMLSAYVEPYNLTVKVFTDALQAHRWLLQDQESPG